MRLEVDVLQFPEVKQTLLEALLFPSRQHVGRLLHVPKASQLGLKNKGLFARKRPH